MKWHEIYYLSHDIARKKDEERDEGEKKEKEGGGRRWLRELTTHVGECSGDIHVAGKLRS